MEQFRHSVVPARHVIRNYPDPTIYGTRGKKEALICAPPSRSFLAGPDGKVRIIIEAKWQETSGSVDEKMPFVWESFLASDVLNWVVIMDGAYWKTLRGKAAVAWMQNRPVPADRTWYVVTLREFIALATDNWRD